MTEEEQAVAYLKLAEDVKQLIVDTVFKELQNYGSPLYSQMQTALFTSHAFKENVKMVVTNQMSK